MKFLRFISLSALVILCFIFTSTSKGQGTINGWTEPLDLSANITSNWRTFAVPLCDPYQNLHTFWADNAENGAAIFYRNDIFDFLSAPIDIIAVNDPSIYYLAAAISEVNDTIYLAWVNGQPGDLYYSEGNLINANIPNQWLEPIALDTGVYNPAIKVDPNGTLHIVYAATNNEGMDYAVFHIAIDPENESISTPQIIYSRSFAYPSYIRSELAIDENNRLHVGITLRSQEYGKTYEVGYLRSLDGGTTWNEYTLIDDTSQTYQGVEWIAPFTFGANEVHLTWHDPRRMHQWSYNGGDTWSEPIEIMQLGGAFGGANFLTKDSNDTLHVVTAEWTGVFSAEWDGTNWGPVELVDDREIDAHGQQLVTCQGNQLHITYTARIGDRSVWYTTKTVDAPHIPRQTIPGSSIDENPVFSPENTPQQQTATNTTAVTPEWHNAEHESYATNPPSNIIFFGLVPVILFIAGCIIFWQFRANKNRA